MDLTNPADYDKFNANVKKVTTHNVDEFDKIFNEKIKNHRVIGTQYSKVPHPKAEELAAGSQLPASSFELMQSIVYFENNTCIVLRLGGIIIEGGRGIAMVKNQDYYFNPNWNG